MRDQELAELAEQFKAAQEKAKRAEANKDKLKAKLVAEMERRETAGIITGGLKITYVRPSYTEYNERRLRKALGDKWDQVVREVLDTNKLAALVQEGEVPLRTVAKCGTEKFKSAYVLVNPA